MVKQKQLLVHINQWLQQVLLEISFLPCVSVCHMVLALYKRANGFFSFHSCFCFASAAFLNVNSITVWCHTIELGSLFVKVELRITFEEIIACIPGWKWIAGNELMASPDTRTVGSDGVVDLIVLGVYDISVSPGIFWH